VLRRQLLAMLLGLELMIAAVNVALVHHAGLFSDVEALAAVAIIIAVAAAEAVVGLSLILRIHRLGGGLDSGALTELRG
jgi:NADH:ubiquinone oxidoreductase subunit K